MAGILFSMTVFAAIVKVASNEFDSLEWIMIYRAVDSAMSIAIVADWIELKFF